MAPVTAGLTITLSKHEGLGNDFLIAVDPPRPLAPADARSWCDRRRGVGADGLIELRSQPSESPFVMTLFNADGSKAEVSGNGLRCAAQALAAHLGLEAPSALDIDTDAGRRHVELLAIKGPLADVRVDMGVAKPGPPDSTAWDGLQVVVHRQVGVDMGNPHLVALVDDPDKYDIAHVGATVEADYPAGLNVHLVSVEADGTIELRVWERGAGVTEACGSGACAAGVAATRWGLVEGPVSVHMPGGAAAVEVVDDNVLLSGPAAYIAQVVVDG